MTDLLAQLQSVYADACRAFGLACAWELRHRVPGQDFRRLLFARELALLAEARSEWASRKAKEIAGILAAHPYDDKACG